MRPSHLQQRDPAIRILASFVPAVSFYFVFHAYHYFDKAARIGKVDLRIPPSAWADHDLEFAGRVGDLLARIMWGLSGMLFVLVWGIGVVGLCGIMLSALANRSRGLRASVAGLALLAAWMIYPAWNKNPLTLKAIAPILHDTFAQMGLVKGPMILHLTTAMALACAILLVIASSAILAPPASAVRSQEETLKQIRLLRWTLYLGAAVLVVGVFHATATHHLPVAWLKSPFSEDFGRIETGVSAATGSLWTLLLLSIYLPSVAILRWDALRLARQSLPYGSHEERAIWLTTAGFVASPWQHLARLGALLGPVLAGGPVATLLQSLRH